MSGGSKRTMVEATESDDDGTISSRTVQQRVDSCLSKMFESCEGDPKGSVHRSWGVTLVMMVFFFVVSIFEMLNLKSGEGSDALMMAAVWTAVVHLVLAIVGTFILKRFPTSFSVGFFLGLLLVIANQDLILFMTFHNYPYGSVQTNHSFANLGLTLFLMLLFFALILSQFREAIVMAAVDVKGFGQGEETTVGSESYFGYEDEESEIASRGQGK